VTAFLFCILALSTWRFTHLVVEDQIPVVKRPRDWVENRWPDSSFAYLVSCTYCSSVWVAAAHVAVVDLWLGVSTPVPVAVAAGLSIVTAFGETVVDWLDRYGT
jgi:hypothetical protein